MCGCLASRPSAAFVVMADVAERAISDGGKEGVTKFFRYLDSAFSESEFNSSIIDIVSNYELALEHSLISISLFSKPMIMNVLCRIPKVTHRTLSDKCRPFSAFVVENHVVVGVGGGSPLHEQESHHHRMPVTQFTEDEQMARDAARVWANEELKPIVRDMDNECKTRPEVIQSLFDNGFLGMVRLQYLSSGS
jgi:hypothetical protein